MTSYEQLLSGYVEKLNIKNQILKLMNLNL